MAAYRLTNDRITCSWIAVDDSAINFSFSAGKRLRHRAGQVAVIHWRLCGTLDRFRQGIALTRSPSFRHLRVFTARAMLALQALY